MAIEKATKPFYAWLYTCGSVGLTKIQLQEGIVLNIPDGAFDDGDEMLKLGEDCLIELSFDEYNNGDFKKIGEE